MKLPRPSNRGFSLFEIILAAAIFVLLAGGVYFAVSTSVLAASELGREQMDARKLGALADFLRRGFQNLPAQAGISLRAKEKEAGNSVQLIIARAAGAFAAGAMTAQGTGVVLATEPDGRGSSSFRVTRFPGRLNGDERDRYLETASWLPLLDEVQSLRWRFFDRNSKRFLETWDNEGERPEMVELTFATVGTPSQTLLFRLPRLGEPQVDKDQKLP
ncbi:MAG: prepilin-type N-terminal cleavage/methylation domain-containing protein [Terrimicrobiaceae bacterium]